jgi:cellulose synthase/poly-beta-1,6-N-acetylglucosamine synthase-like glycosyltransferase
MIFALIPYALLMFLTGIGFLLAKKRQFKKTKSQQFVSVIVPVRNEAKNISRLLDCLMRQNYSSDLYEIIVVDDHSTDETYTQVVGFLGGKANCSVLALQANMQGKKAAISFAVSAAKGDLIVTTDGDCVMENDWLENLIAPFEKNEVQMTGGLVFYRRQKNIIEHILRLEQTALQIASAGSAQLNFPLMCSGANLAYRKSFFEKENGYEGDEYACISSWFCFCNGSRSNNRACIYVKRSSASACALGV